MREFQRLIEAAKQGAFEQVGAIISAHPEFLNNKDDSGATALHYAAFGGYCNVVELLVQQGADINARDAKFGATPAGWAIEYMREMGGFLGIELSDFAFAIRRGDVEWTARFLKRFPALRQAADEHGTPFKLLAQQSGNSAIAGLFELESTK
ncbi:MAG: ankyrin repeat domain-containing protein [Terracidiphilus sp.]